tara:strand:+ start:101 stop:274 length:174 start_codon:yes stop_codon:yes gene_type:complete
MSSIAISLPIDFATFGFWLSIGVLSSYIFLGFAIGTSSGSSSYSSPVATRASFIRFP